MKHWKTIKKYCELARQVMPCASMQTVDDIIELMFIKVFNSEKISLLPCLSHKALLGDTYSLEMCQQAYEDGYTVIINDGKVLGYREEAPTV